MIKLGLIGLGRWGGIYLKTVSEMSGVKILRAAGRAHQQHTLVEYPDVEFTDDWGSICSDPTLDGIIVATSPQSHYEVTKLALDNGIPCIVEKPFTLSLAETIELQRIQLRSNVLCMVAYTHLFSPAYKHLKSRVYKSSGIKKIYSEGFSSGPYRRAVPVLWDWGSHEISMCLDLLQMPVLSSTLSILYSNDLSEQEKIYCLRMMFPQNIEATCLFGNAAEYKRRDFFVDCGDEHFLYDGLSDGLSKSFHARDLSADSDIFKRAPRPMNCLIEEFLYHIKLKSSHHHSLGLAVKVNTLISRLGAGTVIQQ